MHAKREIPVSSCPSFVENMLYASGSATPSVDNEECASFKVMVDALDTKAEKYENQKARRERTESRYHKYNRLGIHNGEWCQVDTDGIFEHHGQRFQIDPSAAQYQPTATEFGDLYDMDRVLVVDGTPIQFYDMNYDEVKVRQL